YTAVPRSLVGAPEVGDTEAKAYYDRNPDQFRMPEKVIVHYVQYPVADYTNRVTVTDEMIATFYESNKQRYLKPAAEGAPEDAAPEYLPLDEVKGSIAELYATELARQEAFNAADKLVARLSDEGTVFKDVAVEAGLKIVSNTPAFGATDRVRGVDPSAPFARAAFNLEQDENHYYSDPVVGRDFVYVISLEKKLPSFLPAFDIVRDEAIESARMAASETAYVEKAAEIHAAIEAVLKSGKSFADAVSKYNLDISTTEPFDISTPLEDEFGREIMGATVQYDAGQLVDLISTPNEFLLAYVASREKADEAAALPALRESLAESIRNEKSSRLVAAWQESLLIEADFEDLTAEAEDNES
ncbi:MAG: peptidyl-prolyl cis-trans isomerase, partial [Pontiella sp.]|nr:peptidyl-prolyl cis-trans isomerase [Pontiella sp.]